MALLKPEDFKRHKKTRILKELAEETISLMKYDLTDEEIEQGNNSMRFNVLLREILDIKEDLYRLSIRPRRR